MIGDVCDLAAAPADWRALLARWCASAPGQALVAFLREREGAGATIFPPRPLRALELTRRDEVAVVVLGQDPYHGPGQAEGLAFSVPPGVTPPPSLRNIFKELERDLGVPPRPHGHLGAWARQGVLLLNTCLTVEEASPACHAGSGWEALTDMIVDAVAAAAMPTVFLLWGAHAQSKAVRLAGADRHLVLCANHPSPLSARRPPRPFIGCGHFGAANRFLRDHGRSPIDWAAH